MRSMSAARDRDEQGRPRSARPRDALGRPLPREAAGSSPELEPDYVSPMQTLDRAQEMLDTGRPFHAHEVLEAAWKAAPDEQRDLWQGLAQLAVGMTHAARGNPAGAVALLSRGIERLSRCPSPAPWNIDIPGLQRWAVESSEALQDATGITLRSPRLCTSDAAARLLRWEEYGGTWRVTARTEDELTLTLCRCDGGEEADQWTSTDAHLLRLVGSRTSSDQTL